MIEEMNFFRRAKALKMKPWELAKIPQGWIDKIFFYQDAENRAEKIGKPEVEKPLQEVIEAQYGDA